MRRFLNTEAWGLGIVVDLRCQNESAVTIFAETSRYRMYDYSYHWLVLGSKLNDSVPLLNDSAYSIITDFVLAITNGSDYDLYDVFNHCKYRGGTLNVTRLGTWRRETGLAITLTQPLIQRRANMHGMTLKISGVIQYRPKNMRLEDYMHDINTRSLDSMHKFTYAMISHTADLFNFSVYASEIIYWDRHSVHGLIFEILHRNYIDFASNPRIMVSERLDYATLVGAAWPIRPCFMLLSTTSNKIKLEIFLKPLAHQTWYSWAIFITIFVFVMRIILRREEDSKQEKYSSAMVLTVGLLAQQGANFFPKRIPSRIALLQILVFNWIMYNYYSASIVSARLSEPLDMMEDSVTVLADSNLKIAAEAVPYLNYFLYKLNWESDYFRKKRWDPLPESKRFLPIEEGMKQVSQGILAYHTDPNTAYPYVERMFDPSKICELTEIHLFKQSIMGMYASHNGQFTEVAKIGLYKMFNTGLRDRQIKYWSSRKPQCQLDTLSTRSISIHETAPALILLAFGMLVGCGICIVENIVYYRSTSLIIRDYFVYKKVTRVVGFSCGDVEDDFLTMKLLTDAGMSTAIKPAGFQINVLRYLDTTRTLGVFLDMRCPNQNVSGIFDDASAYRMFDYSYNWLILGSNMSRSLQSLNDSVFSIVTDFAILLPDPKSGYVLYDVYNHCKMRGGILNVTRLGTWREDNGLAIILTDSKIIRRRDYHGLRAKSAGIVLHRPPHMSLVDYLEGEGLEVMDNWPKFGYTLLSHVSDIFNFTMDLIEINHWEKNDSNGPLMSTLKRDEADLGYYPSILRIERYGDARVIFPQWPTRTCFMFRTIPAMKMKPWIILKPFAADTWYMIVVIVVITVLILSFILKLEHVSEYGYSISALITVGALCQQGFPSITDQSASRIALIQITVFGLLVFNYYSAAIVSARLNEPLHKMNDSLYSLAHSKMQLAAEKNIFFDFLLRNQRPDVQYFKHVWNAIPESKRFIPIEDGVEKIKGGDFAFHADPDDVYPSIEQAFDRQMICQLTEVHLLQPSELGLWSNLKSHFHEISKIAVTIYEAAPILFLLLFGMIISLIIFGIEQLVFYTMHSKRVRGIKNHMKNETKDKTLSKDKSTLIPPKASNLFRKILMTKR
ncbi:hypothetical protein RF55_1087 [Lasius niger]|uniref:Ionotropic receptor 75a N-terminal domain-containing protein n=1 Tax=Lasius niger TaxID=67767 RepID=A0A0J7L7Y1_LASNI|nr:hypothetical protein RF55_1087 [Lasius niger]